MNRKFLHFSGLALLILSLCYGLIAQGWLMSQQKRFQNVFYDLDSASDKIVIVAIDEKTLSAEELGPLTQWSRANYANAVKKLNEAGAAAIGIDITLPDISSLGEQDDRILADTLKSFNNVVLGARYYFQNGERQTDFPNEVLMGAEPKLGWLNVQLDSDNMVRTVPVFMPTKSSFVEAFSLQLARLYLDEEPLNYRVSDSEFQFSQETAIPVMTRKDPDNNQEVHLMYINYFAQPYKFTYMSFSDLLKGRIQDSKGQALDLKNRIVIIGPTAVDLRDMYNSPVGEGVLMPGAEVHANNVQTLITGEFLRDQSPFSLWLTLAALTAINLFLFSFLKVRYSVPLVALELFGMIIAGIVIYEERIFLNIVYPWFVILTSFVGSYLLRFITEQKERRFIEGAFGHYVNKDVVSQIIKNPAMLELGGSKRTISIFFSDIEGFTELSEKMEPVELVAFLNEYLKEMTDIILKHEGTLDKYEGDALMAFWNAPLTIKDHAIKACESALENQKKLNELRDKWKKEGRPEVRIRIGINTGEAVVGNMGSESRFDYTAMGDSVNLASRLEGINKEYGTGIVISESTYLAVQDKFTCRELDLIRVKGKSVPVRIFELIGKKEDETPELRQKNLKFAEALRDYRSKNFEAAREKFQAIRGDRVSELYAKRCEAFINSVPPNNWDGVYTFTTK